MGLPHARQPQGGLLRGQGGVRANDQARQGGGGIVNIASILGLSPGVSQANYGASKAALLHLTKTLAVEVSRNGIRCNALSPGYFETEIEWRVFPL